MTPDLQKEFRLLSDRARQELRNVAASGSYRCVFSIWTMPSWAPSCRCTIYSPKRTSKEKLPFAEYSIWRSDLDVEKFRTPIERLKHPNDLTPTFEHDVLWLTDDEVERIEQRIHGISIPVYLGRCVTAGCDGTSYEFRCDEVVFSGSFHWWENYPVEWRPFTEIVMQIAAELEVRRREKGPGVSPNVKPAPAI